MFLSLDELAAASGRTRPKAQLRWALDRGLIPHANLHDLRRKRLTDLTRERGVDFAQSIAAHSDPKMTQTYVSGEGRVRL